MSIRPSLSSWRSLVGALALALLLWSAGLPRASAQEVRTLNIQDGTVYVNGRPLSEEELPDGLNLEGVTAQYRFLGIQRPVIELNGRLFAVEDGLTPVAEEELRADRASVILQDWIQQSPSQPSASRSATAHRDYLDAVQRSSRELYERLMRERRMEREARQLAHAIRLLPGGRERQAQIDSLRAMLGDIFELKQENRHREIKRLQQQIRKLQKSIQKRERMRERMIDRRLRQLIDPSQK